MRRAVFPLLLFLFGFILGLLCLFPIHTVSPKMDAAPLTASRAGEEPASTSEASTSGLLRAAAVRWSGQGCLLNRPYLQVTGILWLISLAVEIVRWIVTLPPMQAFAATTLSSGTRTYQALWDKFAATLPFLYVPRITAAVVLTVLAVTALTVRRKNGAGAAQSKDEAA